MVHSVHLVTDRADEWWKVGSNGGRSVAAAVVAATTAIRDTSQSGRESPSMMARHTGSQTVTAVRGRTGSDEVETWSRVSVSARQSRQARIARISRSRSGKKEARTAAAVAEARARARQARPKKLA